MFKVVAAVRKQAITCEEEEIGRSQSCVAGQSLIRIFGVIISVMKIHFSFLNRLAV